ncbi:hypothetical protein J9303_20860, partial [Bacillaceae bacterium Marseille-Q3522]|nr:hypothetical protein [Bacillaceae bacterium Marseille-Q3522]
EYALYIFNITLGNPFYIKQIILSIQAESSFPDGKKADDLLIAEHFVKININENVIDYLVRKFNRLPKNMQLLLKIAACFGNQINSNHLALTMSLEQEVILNKLWFAVEAGMLLPLKEVASTEDHHVKHFYFIHDRVQQAIYSLISSDEKTDIHAMIGKNLKKQLAENEQNEALFNVCEHLNLGQAKLSGNELLQLAVLNKRAGELAKQKGAFEYAFRFFLQAKKLLPRLSWEEHYHLSVQVWTGVGETAYLNSEFSLAEEAFNKVIENGKNIADRLKVYNLKITLYTHLHRISEAVESGLKGLQLFGWSLKKSPGKTAIVRELLLILLTLRNRKPEDLANLKKMDNEQHRLIMQTLINLNAPAYHENQNLATVLMLRAFRYTLKFGVTDLTALVFNNYALIQSAGFQNFEKCYQYGKLAVDLVELLNKNSLKGRVYFVYGSFINHWREHLRQNTTYLRQSQAACLAAGNIHLAGATSSFIIMTKMMEGNNLQEVLQEINEQFKFVTTINFQLSLNYLAEMKHWVEVLM